ncbi:MAG: TetR/AcrR family transcriptional regulator [Candidatus Geothermincolia bacterium]
MQQQKLSRKQKGELTRRQLFESAMQLFSEKGYERVTVDDICLAAGVSKGAFYTHFESKDQVVVETFLKADDFYNEVYPQVLDEANCVERLRSFCRLVMGNILESGVMVMRVSYYGQIAPGRVDSAIASRERPLYRLTERLLRDGQETGEIRSDIASSVMAEAVIHSLRGLVYDWCQQNGEFDLLEYSEVMMQLLLSGLQPASA